jgi:hypothetical protein
MVLPQFGQMNFPEGITAPQTRQVRIFLIRIVSTILLGSLLSLEDL